MFSFTFFVLVSAAPSLAESPPQPLAQTQMPTMIAHDDKTHVFKNHQTDGTFVLYDVAQETLHLVNSSRANQPFIPASTFKIANSLIALETGVIADENEIIPYGGGSTFIKAWAQDMPLPKAFAISNVPVYQELARRIGLKRYQTWLDKLEYGNANPGQNVETFWLRGPLKISAVDQTIFIAKLAHKQLPLSKRVQSIVSDISIVDKKAGKTLHGKTGWTTTQNPDIGWFVGWVQHENNTYAFALNIDMSSRKDASKRRPIAEAFLAMFDVY
jgi:beta-lactamase class D